MIFEKVIPTTEQIETLYSQLEKRSQNISHKLMPSFKEHATFVRNHPYREWMIIKFRKRAIGNAYIQFDNSIGLHLVSPEDFEQFVEILNLIYRSYSPLPAKPSVRIGEFFLRVPSDNHKLQERLIGLGFHEVERTFVPKREIQGLRN